ncbi:MAG TPA: asparagine synthase-related protein [Thermoanaerobaculia bacterium]|nr:asparagine synthase-related protein [Thermoanaerobaculia bacterium]
MRAAIGAVCELAGRALDPRELASLGRRARLPVPYEQSTWSDASTGLLAMTPRRAAAPGPFAAGGCAVVLDGTIDNRAELLADLPQIPGQVRAPSDAALILAAYSHWGATCAARLLGEFAFILWDGRRQRLVCARDPFGLRSLFYTANGGRLCVASQTLQLLDTASATLSQLDEEYVADFLAAFVAIGPHTPFKGVRRLPAGHVLVADRGVVRTEPYWDFDPAPSVELKTDADYAARFLELFRQAVACGLRSGKRAWAELSGGLDSSSVVCVAQELIRDDPALGRGFATVTLTWDETPQCDERAWSAPVVEKYRLINHQLNSDDQFFHRAQEGASYRSEPHFGLLCFPMLKREADLLYETGVDVLLSGARAESVLLPEAPRPLHLADLLRRLRLRELRRELSAWQESLHEPLVNVFLSSCLLPLLRPRLLRRSPHDGFALASWVDRGFARRMHLRDRARLGRMPRRFASPADQFQYELLHRAEQNVNRGYIEWCCELRHPFLYRPLVEFALAAPWQQKIRPGEHKSLLRRAMVGILPEIVRTRRDKRGPGAAGYKAFARRWHEIAPVVDSSLLVAMGYVDGRAFRHAAEQVRLGASESFGAFTTTLAFEYWLRAAFAGESPRMER